MPTTINFTDLSQSDQNIVSWSWDFGDGGTSTGQNPSHEYAEDGLYSVTLVATNALDVQDTKTQDVLVSGDGFWSHTFDFRDGDRGWSVFLDAGGRVDGKGYPSKSGPVILYYNLPVTKLMTGAEMNCYRYPPIGFQTKVATIAFYEETVSGPGFDGWVDLDRPYEASDSDSFGSGPNYPAEFVEGIPQGRMNIIGEAVPTRGIVFFFWGVSGSSLLWGKPVDQYLSRITIKGLGADPFDDFVDVTWEAEVDGLSVEFTDTSVSGAIESWLWDFGDGDTSTEQNPTHVYDEEDTYTVRLTVTTFSETEHFHETEVAVGDEEWESNFDFTIDAQGFTLNSGTLVAGGIEAVTAGGGRSIHIQRSTNPTSLVHVRAVFDWTKGTFLTPTTSNAVDINLASPFLSINLVKASAMPSGPTEYEYIWDGGPVGSDGSNTFRLRIICNASAPVIGDALLKSLRIRGTGTKPTGWP